MHSSSGHQASRRYASLFTFWTRLNTHPSLSRLGNSDFLLCNRHPHIQARHIIYHGLPSYSNCAPKTSSSSIDEPRTARFSANWCLLELDHFQVLSRTGCHILPLYVYLSCIILHPLFSRIIPPAGQHRPNTLCMYFDFCVSNNSIYLMTRMFEKCYLGLQIGTR